MANGVNAALRKRSHREGTHSIGKRFIDVPQKVSGNVMLIKKHDKSDIVELEDGSRWRIWPGDIAATLQWLPTTELRVVAIGDEFCSHNLIDQKDGLRVRVIDASADWPVAQVRRSLKEG
jgi:hypothetical protein